MAILVSDCADPWPALRAKSERVDAGQLAADHQLVHGLGALVGDHRLQVQRVADRADARW